MSLLMMTHQSKGWIEEKKGIEEIERCRDGKMEGRAMIASRGSPVRVEEEDMCR